MTTFLIVVLILLCVLMVLVVLVQRGRGGGLSGAFGSGGGSNSAFGTKTGDVFTTVTVVLFVVFMLLSIWLSYRFRDASQVTTRPAATRAMAPSEPGQVDVERPIPVPPTPIVPTVPPATVAAENAAGTTVPATTTAPK